MTQLELEVAIDGIAEQLRADGNDADKIESLLLYEASRVAQEVRDGDFG